MKGGSVFSPRPALDLNYKITAMDAYQGLMYTGDEKGNIYRYQVTPDDVQVLQSTQMLSKSITRSRIEQIKVLPFAQGNLLVISDSTLFYIDQFLKGEPVCKDKCVMFTVNEFSKHHGSEVAVVTKKKEGLILQYNQKSGKFEQLREKFLLPEIPATIAFMGNFFYLGIARKNYQLINLEDKQLQVTNLPIDISNNPCIRATDQDEILIITTNNIGIFIGKDGQIKQKNTLNLVNKPFITVQVFKPFIIVLFENLMQVYNLTDARPMSDISLQSGARCITQTSSHLFYGGHNEIMYLYQTPPDQQIQELLKKGMVEEAIQVFVQHNPDPTKNAQLEQLKLDCAWALVRQMQFTQALNYLSQVNYEPRDFICLFPDFYSAVQKLEALTGNPSKFTISLVITQYVQDNMKGDQKKVMELKQQARDFFIEILEKKRSQLTSPQYAYSMKDKLSLLTSNQCFNQNQWHAIPCEQMLDLIDFAMIKAYFDSQQFQKLKQFLTATQIYCIQSYPELQILFQNSKIIQEQHQGILARFYESFNKIDLALEVWRTLGGDSLSQNVWEEACEESVRIMKTNPDKNRIFKFIIWIFRKSFGIGTKIFSIPETVITPDQMLKFLDELEIDSELRRKLKERYLEVLVLDKATEEERFHTQLAYSYIDACFSFIPKNSDYTKLDFNKNTKAADYYKLLRTFLSNPNAKYNSSSLLEKRVQGSWMIPELIQLYGREKRHEDALNQLINLNEFQWAEKYCCEYTDQLLTKLFKKYIELFNYVQNKATEKALDVTTQTRLKEIKTIINNFLKKYATHPQLNPLQVLETIPEKWILADTGSEDGLFQFLNSVISHTLHQKRSTKAAFHLSDMDLLNVECMYADAKQANIRITTEKKCAVCNRSIGDKVFVVYPNAVVAHHTCIKNNTVCPLTEKDFEKYFKF